MSESDLNQQDENYDSCEEQEYISLGELQYKMKNLKLENGSIGTIWVALRSCLQNLTSNKTSPFGKKCAEILPLLTPFMNAVDALYEKAYYMSVDEQSEEFNRMFDAVFYLNFNPRAFYIPPRKVELYSLPGRKGNTYHFNATIQDLVLALISRVRLWADVLEFGWRKRQWAAQLELAELFQKLASTIPDPVTETFQVPDKTPQKTSEESTQDTTDATVEDSKDEAKEDSNDESKAEPVKMKTITYKSEVLVKQIGLILHQAAVAQRMHKQEREKEQEKERAKPKSRVDNDDDEWKNTQNRKGQNRNAYNQKKKFKGKGK